MLPRQKIWNAMRVLKTFSFVELQHSNGDEKPLSFDTVRRYVLILERAGYVAELTKGRFRLVKNTGKFAPSFVITTTKEGLFITDNNLKALVPVNKDSRMVNKINRVHERLSKIIKVFKGKEFHRKDIEALFENITESIVTMDILRLQRQGLVIKVRKDKQYMETGKPIMLRVYKMIDEENQQ